MQGVDADLLRRHDERPPLEGVGTLPSRHRPYLALTTPARPADLDRTTTTYKSGRADFAMQGTTMRRVYNQARRVLCQVTICQAPPLLV